MENAAVLSAAQGDWQQRFRDLKLTKLKIVQFILNTNSFIPNTPPKLKALKYILIKQQYFLLFITLYIIIKNLLLFISGASHPAAEDLYSPGYILIQSALRTACFRIAD
jgi:hypothetical protein